MAALPTTRGLFRSLLRARAVAFKGDERALAASRAEIRKHFDVRVRAPSPDRGAESLADRVHRPRFVPFD